jgi:hypothetical protein
MITDMTEEEAQAEATRRWGTSGTAKHRPLHPSRGNRGRLARYCYTVSNGLASVSARVEGQGNSWREAFADARASQAEQLAKGM